METEPSKPSTSATEIPNLPSTYSNPDQLQSLTSFGSPRQVVMFYDILSKPLIESHRLLKIDLH